MTDAAAIARLFVALPLPAPIVETLARLQPSPQKGVRLLQGADLHVTLHFLGSAEPSSVRDALRRVAAGSFRLRLGRPGRFAMKRRRRILWVGVEPADELLALHAQTGRALESIGFEAEKRRFRPHVTLARLSEEAPKGVVEAFLNQSLPDDGAEFVCSRFAVFESKTAPTGARYRVLESYPLRAAD